MAWTPPKSRVQRPRRSSPTTGLTAIVQCTSRRLSFCLRCHSGCCILVNHNLACGVKVTRLQLRRRLPSPVKTATATPTPRKTTSHGSCEVPQTPVRDGVGGRCVSEGDCDWRKPSPHGFCRRLLVTTSTLSMFRFSNKAKKATMQRPRAKPFSKTRGNPRMRNRLEMHAPHRGCPGHPLSDSLALYTIPIVVHVIHRHQRRRLSD